MDPTEAELKSHLQREYGLRHGSSETEGGELFGLGLESGSI